MLTLYKRHTKKCAERRLTTEPGKTLGELRADRGCRRCTCSIYAEGTLRIDGFVRKATRRSEEEMGGSGHPGGCASGSAESRSARAAHDRACGPAIHERPEGLRPLAEYSQEISPVYRSTQGVLRGKRDSVQRNSESTRVGSFANPGLGLQSRTSSGWNV